MGQGSVGTVATLLQPLTEPYGYSSSDASLFGAAAILSGIVGANLASKLVTLT